MWTQTAPEHFRRKVRFFFCSICKIQLKWYYFTFWTLAKPILTEPWIVHITQNTQNIGPCEMHVLNLQ
jgi:hypothetical protein